MNSESNVIELGDLVEQAHCWLEDKGFYLPTISAESLVLWESYEAVQDALYAEAA